MADDVITAEAAGANPRNFDDNPWLAQFGPLDDEPLARRIRALPGSHHIGEAWREDRMFLVGYYFRDCDTEEIGDTIIIAGRAYPPIPTDGFTCEDGVVLAGPLLFCLPETVVQMLDVEFDPDYDYKLFVFDWIHVDDPVSAAPHVARLRDSNETDTFHVGTAADRYQLAKERAERDGVDLAGLVDMAVTLWHDSECTGDFEELVDAAARILSHG